MTNLYYSPTFYGIHDVTASIDGASFGARIYYPSDDGAVWEAPIRTGRYPLIVFAHGDRAGESGLCPSDRTTDYQRWSAVLHLLARCGFVVIAPAVHDVVNSPDATAERIEQAVRWIRSSWVGRHAIHLPHSFLEAERVPASLPIKPDRKLRDILNRQNALIDNLRPDLIWRQPTELGLIGHSWGARGCALAAVRGVIHVDAIASLAGTWDDNAANTAFTGANRPTVMIVGGDDIFRTSYLNGFWPTLPTPKHQAVIHGLEHWDWFGGQGGIHPCDAGAPRPACPVGWQTASELLLGFMTKHLHNHWWRPPYLLGSPGGRPPLLHWFDGDGPCAIKIRWHDPSAQTSLGNPGEVTLGSWSGSAPW